MCAICGVVNLDHSEPLDGDVLRRMTDLMSHRGPDDRGEFCDRSASLGFRRLSIIDLKGGHQPIFNEDESAVIVFNGEIYNYRDLAKNLTAAGHRFRTSSDTETILHAYEEYGDDCVQHLRGMFAFAIWDRRRRRLLLARDRVGKKPLYYYRDGRFLAFASEIKSLLTLDAISPEVDTDAFDQYLALRYVPGPRTMFKNIFRLQPGHTLVLDEAGVYIRRYWDIRYSKPDTRSAEQLVGEFRELLEESVRLRLMSEVPLGVFLSGGLDSTAILATMSKLNGGQRIKTFSVGYGAGSKQEVESSEFEYARLAAKKYNAEHYEYQLSADEFEAFAPDMAWHLDEPLADPSCIPLHYISKVATEHITVALSGEGADEILAGYGIYPRMLALDGVHKRFPSLRRITPWLERMAPSEAVRRYLRMSGQPLETNYRGVCRGFVAESRRRLIGDPRVDRSEQLLDDLFAGHFKSVEGSSALNRMLYVDAKVWLPDDLLLKADKMTMANGIELRVPFLDHKLVEFAAALPDDAKLNGVGKSLLRRAMRGIVPDTIIDRPKKGFPVPLASWLRGPLRSFTRDHLTSANSACDGFVDRAELNRLIDQHEQGTIDRSQELWSLLVFQLWHENFIANPQQRRHAA